MADALFRTDERKRLLHGLELHFEAPLVPVGNCLVQLRQAFGFGIAMVDRVFRCFVERVEDVAGGGQVRVADAEGDDIDALGALGGDLL